MRTSTPNAGSMKDAMKSAVDETKRAGSQSITPLFELLGEAEGGLRESGYLDAVLELRQGQQTDYGLRYTVYLRNDSGAFENPMFSVFIDLNRFAFQAEGKIQSVSDINALLATARDYLLKANVVEYMTGLLKQFERPVFMRGETGITVPFPVSKIVEIVKAPEEKRLRIVEDHIAGWNLFASEAQQILTDLLTRFGSMLQR
jgi:hypothetical protein